MVAYTTVMLYKRILGFWYKTGISPLNFKLNPDTTNFSFDTESKSGSDITSEKNAFGKFQVYQVTSWKEAKPLFWFTLAFSVCGFVFSATKLLILMKETGKSTMPSIIGGVCWCSYILSCCFIYVMHLAKARSICNFFGEWQTIEGEILTESKAMDFLRKTKGEKFWDNGHGIPAFCLRSQMWGMRPFIITIPASIVLMGFNIGFSPRYPMYLYSLVPDNVEIPWLKFLCFILTWMEVYFFALCENQIEILYTAFAKSVSSCLKILTMPAKIWSPYNPKTAPSSPCLHHVPKLICKTGNPMLIDNASQPSATAVDVLSTFEDSVEKFERLSGLVTTFNKIFAWPMFIFKSFTMLRLCCYVYVILKHPQETAFPATVVFPYAVFAIFFKFGLSLTSLGEVYSHSLKFLKYWKKLLMLLNQSPNWRERLLKSCSRFGFRCGNLYTIRPQTILTFYSVTLTYLIILLQL